MSHYAQILAVHLDALTVPESLTRQLDYGPIGSWPPRPGSGRCPDLALARTWARIDLAQWIDEAPQAFGAHRDGELAGLAAAGAQLARAGEGTQVLWAIDLIPPEQWVDPVPSPALAVAELVCIGPICPRASSTQSTRRCRPSDGALPPMLTRTSPAPSTTSAAFTAPGTTG